MAPNLNTARLTESGNILTPKGPMMWANLYQPQLPPELRGRPNLTKEDMKKAKYQITLFLPAKSDYGVLEAAVQEVLDENLPPVRQKTTKFRWPFLSTADQPKWAEYADDFPTFIRCNSTFRPEVVSATNRPIPEEDEADEIYNGRFCRLSVRPFWYPASKNGSPIPGVSIGLQNVQLLDHGEPMAGGRVRAENEFESVEQDDLADLEG